MASVTGDIQNPEGPTLRVQILIREGKENYFLPVLLHNDFSVIEFLILLDPIGSSFPKF